MPKTKKAQAALNMLVSGVIMFVFVVVALVVGSKITTSIKGTITDTTSAAYNATAYGEQAFQTFGEQLPTVAIVLVMGSILAILVGVFAFTYMKNR